MMKVFNATPHPITILTPEGEKVEIPPSGVVVRLQEEDVAEDSISLDIGINVPLRVRRLKSDAVKQLIEEIAEKEGKPLLVIVSLPVLMGLGAQVVRELREVILAAPDTGKGAVRNEKGEIIGVTALITLL